MKSNRLLVLVGLGAVSTFLIAGCGKKPPKTFEELEALQKKGFATYGKMAEKERYATFTKEAGDPHEVSGTTASWFGIRTYNEKKDCMSLEVTAIDGSATLGFDLREAPAAKCGL